MFIGHFGVALGAKRLVPTVSLGTLIFAAEFLDLIWPIFLLLGLEHVRIAPGITKVSLFDFYDYPISHSLITVLGWSIVVGGGHFVLRRNRAAAIMLVIAVLSHWVLDFVTHRPDLPLWPTGPKVGLGIWNSWTASIVTETFVFAAGLLMYMRKTRSRDRVGEYAFWSLATFLVLGWISSLVAGAPPSTAALAWGGLTIWLTVPWGWWADSHRSIRPPV
jgi:LexA-binding, inner membrane-associated putative hydrolase